jgi:hypothetical protein
MPVYKLSPSESGGFRILLPPDPKPPSKAWQIFGYVLTFVVGLVVGVVNCALLDDSISGPRQGDAPLSYTSN